jgi:hypothetical protein
MTQGRFSLVSINPDVIETNRAVLLTDVKKIKESAAHKDSIKRLIGEKRQRYKYFTELFGSIELQKELLANIEKSAKSLMVELERLPADVPSIRELVSTNEKATKKDISAVLIWLNAQFNVAQGLTKEQILSMADTITIEFSELWMEDIATCFKEVILNRKNNNTYALDSATVLGWLSAYRDKQHKESEFSNLNKHLAHK